MPLSEISNVEICKVARQSETLPAVSVVIPAYNRAATLGQAVRSVLCQSWQNLELIIVDDGSQDNTVEIACAFDDPRVTVLRLKENAGPSVARNTGILGANAPIVAFQDSDDIWLLEKLEGQMKQLSDPKVVASYCGMLVTGQSEEDPSNFILTHNPLEGFADGQITRELLKTNIISTQTLVARRKDLITCGLFDNNLRYLEDWDLALRLSMLGAIRPLAGHYVVQRFSDNSLTYRTDEWAWAHKAVLLKHSALLAQHPDLAARQWQIVSGRFYAMGNTKESLAALRSARFLVGASPKLFLQVARSVILGLWAKEL